MTEEVAEHAVEPFFTTKEIGKGSGLGLSTVYGFVEQTGGHLIIDSIVDRGTTIALYLPRDTTTATGADADELHGETPLGRGEIILVVEDDPSVRAFAIKVLERLGYVTHQADSADAALEILRSYPRVDLLLTDVVLRGGMNGVGLAVEAAQFRPDLPVLLLSGYEPQSFEIDRETMRGMGFIAKPFRINELAQAVRESLDSTDLPATPMGEAR
jgi:CheY-like chemotaxis protein